MRELVFSLIEIIEEIINSNPNLQISSKHKQKLESILTKLGE